MYIIDNFHAGLPPTLVTVRCALTPLEQGDFEDISRLLQNPRVRAYLGGPVAAEEVVVKLSAMLADQKAWHWVVRLLEDARFTGLVSLTPHHDGDDYEISYEIDEMMQGRGFGVEIVRSVLNFAVTTMGLRRVVAETQMVNHASIRLLEKLGMGLEREVERFDVRQGIFVWEKV